MKTFVLCDRCINECSKSKIFLSIFRTAIVNSSECWPNNKGNERRFTVMETTSQMPIETYNIAILLIREFRVLGGTYRKHGVRNTTELINSCR